MTFDENELQSARRKGKIAEAIADLYVENAGLNIATTEHDLRAAGFTDTEIAANAARARSLAARRVADKKGRRNAMSSNRAIPAI